MRYEQPDEGEWVQPVLEGYKMACCDCGLVHKMDFRIEDGQPQFRAFRDNRATGQVRRHKEIEMTNDNGINNRAIPFSEWTKDANKVIATARGYVRSIAMLPLGDMAAAGSGVKAVELANELLVVLDAAPYGQLEGKP